MLPSTCNTPLHTPPPPRQWNEGELQSFLIEISTIIMAKKDDQKGKTGYIIDHIVDKTGAKGTGARA